MAATWSQATVHGFDEEAEMGSVITDDGQVMIFASAVWAASPLRTVRPGQRVQVAVDRSVTPPAILALTLVTFPTDVLPT